MTAAFASALDKMRNESDPPEIKDVAQSLARKYEASKSGHQEQLTIRDNAVTGSIPLHSTR